MEKITYEKINDYCTSKYKGILVQAERDYVLRKFLDSYYEALDKYKENNGVEADNSQKQTIVSSLLNDSTLLSYIDSAKSYYEKFTNNLESEFKKTQDKPIFWKNVGISVLANFIYSIILIVVFFVAKDQIANWLMQLGK